MIKKERTKINNQITAKELRVLGPAGENLGVLSFKDAFERARETGLDLIEVAPMANPPVAKIMDYGKYKYEASKKERKMRSGTKSAETKSLQVKPGTGENDLTIKARQASQWLKEGHRIKIELFLPGRSKYLDESFLKTRLDRILLLITESYKIADPYKKSPKGLVVVIEKSDKKHAENKQITHEETAHHPQRENPGPETRG